jgi:hypothetical protein
MRLQEAKLYPLHKYTFGVPPGLTQMIASMYPCPNGYWRTTSWGCWTDEGQGRIQDCNYGGGPEGDVLRSKLARKAHALLSARRGEPVRRFSANGASSYNTARLPHRTEFRESSP